MFYFLHLVIQQKDLEYIQTFIIADATNPLCNIPLTFILKEGISLYQQAVWSLPPQLPTCGAFNEKNKL
jgi:hypothetical protein